MTDALVIVDMQVGLLDGVPKHDLDGVVARLSALASRVRDAGGLVVFIRHEGEPGDEFAPGSHGWEFLDGLTPSPEDAVVTKTLNDAFHGTELQTVLESDGIDRVLIAGWATDFCVDATVRSAAARGFRVVVVRDCHTLADRPHLPARAVIEHHEWIWTHLIAPVPVELLRAGEID